MKIVFLFILNYGNKCIVFCNIEGTTHKGGGRGLPLNLSDLSWSGCQLSSQRLDTHSPEILSQVNNGSLVLFLVLLFFF